MWRGLLYAGSTALRGHLYLTRARAYHKKNYDQRNYSLGMEEIWTAPAGISETIVRRPILEYMVGYGLVTC